MESISGGADNRPTTTPYGARALAAEVARLAQATEGERNTTLNAVWIKLSQRVNGGHLDRDQAWQRVYDTARKIGLEDREIRATMQSAENGARSHPWPVPPPRQPSNGYLGFGQPGGVPDVATSTGNEVATQEAAFLPDEFWLARDYLAHIRQAAHSDGQAAEAVLGAVLARVAAITPHRHKLPPSRCLTLIVALIGPSGDGKTSANELALDLVPRREPLEDVCDGVPPGSGEGMIEMLFDWEQDDDGKRGRKVQKRHNAFIYLDEGQTLAIQSRRNASNTILPTLRSAFMGVTLGQQNAARETTRKAPRGSYVYGVVLGIQPELADDILADVHAGTPQRLLWLPTEAPVPHPDHQPGPPDGPLQLRRIDYQGYDQPGGNRIFDVDAEITKAWKLRRWERKQGIRTVDPLDVHADLIRLKVAALFAVMDGRTDIDRADWWLAGHVMLVSTGTRSRAIDTINAANVDKTKAQGRAAGRRKIAETETVADEGMSRAGRKIMNKLRAANGDWVNRGPVKNACGRDAEHFDDAAQSLHQSGQIDVQPHTTRTGAETEQYRLAGGVVS